MGKRSVETAISLGVWKIVELNLMDLFICRGEVNKRSQMKVWGAVVEDVWSGAVHINIVTDYSTVQVLVMLWKFAANHGWPSKICADPGSQLESAAGKMVNWWSNMKDKLQEAASE